MIRERLLYVRTGRNIPEAGRQKNHLSHEEREIGVYDAKLLFRVVPGNIFSPLSWDLTTYRQISISRRSASKKSFSSLRVSCFRPRWRALRSLVLMLPISASNFPMTLSTTLTTAFQLCPFLSCNKYPPHCRKFRQNVTIMPVSY